MSRRVLITDADDFVGPAAVERFRAEGDDVTAMTDHLGSRSDVEALVAEHGQFDVVIANILAGPLVQFADSITSRLARGGMLALSGVLCEQARDVRAAYAPWIEFDEPAFREQDDQTWSRLTGKRRD